MKVEIESSVEFERTPNRLLTRKGANLEIECRVDCNSSESTLLGRPRIRIEKIGISGQDGNVSNQNNNKLVTQRFTHGNHSKLVLENVEKGDGGRYVCYSEVIHSSASSLTPFLYFDLVVVDQSSDNPAGKAFQVRFGKIFFS